MKAQISMPLLVPALFCGFISFMALFMGETAKPAFFSFLPMCFFFAAMPLVAMNKRITELEAKLKERNESH